MQYNIQKKSLLKEFERLIAHLPFWPAGRLDYGRHAISVQALGLREVDHIENDSLKDI